MYSKTLFMLAWAISIVSHAANDSIAPNLETKDTIIAEIEVADTVIADTLLPGILLPDTLLIDTLLTDTLVIIGTGDIMLGTDYPSATYLAPGRSCKPLMADVCHILKSAGITFGNLEGTFAGNAGTPKRCRDTVNCYVFRMPQEYIDCFTECGFNLLSTANNHSNDFGYGGRRETQKILDASGIHNAGYEDKPYTIFEAGNLKIGFCAFAPNTGTSDSRNYAHVRNNISMLDTLCDIVIVSIHTGAEGANHQRLPKTDEIYLGHNRGNIYEFSRVAIDAGADVVFGHGPHVTRAIDLYKGRFIAYSLGNFSTYRRFNLSGPNGYAPIIKLYVDKNGAFLKGEIIPIYQEGEGITRLDPHKRAIHKTIELTKADFPSSLLEINTDGVITIRQQ